MIGWAKKGGWVRKQIYTMMTRFLNKKVVIGRATNEHLLARQRSIEHSWCNSTHINKVGKILTTQLSSPQNET